MRSGEQIYSFGDAVDKALADVRSQLPPDLIIERTSDQPKQVKELVDLLTGSLWEAIALVVIVALIGFWDWRAAMLMAASIPLTLALTFGVVLVLGIDIQQVSIATLIISLGLLVDMPVVAGDAIKRELGHGLPRDLASWIGPSKLAKAIVFATITNIVAYLPFLLLTGDTYFFLYSLPVVMTATLLASVIVSFTFMPLIAYYLIKPPAHADPPMAERRTHGFAGFYYRVGDFALRHRWGVLVGSLGILAAGWMFMSRLNPQFFPKDLLPVLRRRLAASGCAARRDERGRGERRARHPGGIGTVREGTSRRHGPEDAHHVRGGRRPALLVLGGSGAAPAQLRADHRRGHRQALHDELVGPLQTALSRDVPGARIDVRQLRQASPWHPHFDPCLGRGRRSPAPALERAAGDLPGSAHGHQGPRRLG